MLTPEEKYPGKFNFKWDFWYPESKGEGRGFGPIESSKAFLNLCYLYDIKARKPQGVRGPEDLIWGHYPQAIGVISTNPGSTTAGSETMLEEYLAVDEAGNALPFEVDGIPKLEEYRDDWREYPGADEGKAFPLQDTISPKDFPEVLLVHDPDKLTHPRRYSWVDDTRSREEMPGEQPDIIEYKLVRDPRRADGRPWCAVPPTKKLSTVATLRITDAGMIGVGNSGKVYEGVVMFYVDPNTDVDVEPEGAVHDQATSEQQRTNRIESVKTRFLKEIEVVNNTGTVPKGEFPGATVVAKIPFNSTRGNTWVHNEAKIYQSFPQHLMQNWSGHQIVSKTMRTFPAVAIVPKVSDTGYLSTPPDIDLVVLWLLRHGDEITLWRTFSAYLDDGTLRPINPRW